MAYRISSRSAFSTPIAKLLFKPMKQKSLPSNLLLYFFRLIPLRFCNFRGGASRREVLLSLPLLVLWYGILYVVALCFQDSLPAFIPPASIPYIPASPDPDPLGGLDFPLVESP